MDHYDLKHCTQEDTIEFEILSNLSDEKKPHFKDGEPVRFMSIGDEYAIASLNNDTRVVKVKPTNAHYKSIVDGILGRGRVCLTAVINNPIFDSQIYQNTAESLILPGFFSGAFSFYYIVFFLNQIWMIDFYDFSRDCLLSFWISFIFLLVRNS